MTVVSKLKQAFACLRMLVYTFASHQTKRFLPLYPKEMACYTLCSAAMPNLFTPIYYRINIYVYAQLFANIPA